MRKARTLPVFDMTRLRTEPDSAAAVQDARDLRDICHHQGFCYVIGHGLVRAAEDVFETAEQFFALPANARQALAIANTPHFRGYTLLGDERTKGARDWRDQMDFSHDEPAKALAAGDPPWLNLRGPNQWPPTLPQMRPVITDWLAQMHDVGTIIMRAMAVGLELGGDYFAPYFAPRGDARLKLIRYQRPQNAADSDQGVGWHHDTGFLTFIVQDEVGGLQVDIDGQIIDATPMPGAMIMNMGEMLQVATGGYFRATPHRVKSPPPGVTRKSIAYFFNPKLESVFEPIPLPPHLAAKARGAQNIDPADPVFNRVGENILKTRLRAHPDVANKFYS